MRSLFVSLLFLFASGFALAQVNVGFRAAYGQSNLRTDDQLDLISDQFSSASSTNAGLYVELPVSEVFSLRSGLELNRRGTSLSLDESVEVFGFDLPFGATAKTRFTYVDVPLLAQVHVPTGSALRPYVFGGASVGYATGGNIRTTARAIIDFNLMTTNLDLDAINYERFHVAAIGGLGVKAEVAQGFSVFAEGRYEQSLTQPYDVPILNAKTGFKGFNFGAGVAFTLE